MLSNVQTDNINKKKNFDNQLRKPVKKPMQISPGGNDSDKKAKGQKEEDRVSPNYLASVDFIFESQKKKVEFLEQQKEKIMKRKDRQN
eukprot:CAMPEP_0170540360 /NCGR_PEP_ID=MMETSP0211-20121228/365_1 /TAXON_ID=311385 /ORGANISM="Pseudokeronopsis sp., Strain OXSARD2" /LENGTH=87 /DNA_ID=CAMNT_0010842727 /DNA_START=995 /DNA_END=1258 /DNA_ORIENTATION=+